MAEVAITNSLKYLVRLNTLVTIDVFFCDNVRKVPTQFLSIIDIILLRIFRNNIFWGGLLIIFSLDHTQIQTVKGRPLLTSTRIIKFFKSFLLDTSFQESGYQLFQSIQHISCFFHQKYKHNPVIIDEFVALVYEHFIFVKIWTSDHINPSTYHLYGRIITAKEAARKFIEQVRRSIKVDYLR